jgi:hypothetical protein
MKKKIILLLSVGLLASYSCQKANLTPPLATSVSNQNYAPFLSAPRIQAQVLGLYNTIRSGNSFGGRYEVDNDIKGENWLNTTANGITGYNTWRGASNSVDTEVLNLWSQCYLSINDCNVFIDGMTAAGTAVVGTTVAAKYVAEARFIRALNYYGLLVMYCKPYAVSAGATPGVPLRLVGNTSAGNFDLAPATVAAVFAQIAADLTYAQTNLPPAYFVAGSTTSMDATANVTRASQNTATALLTRVYLSMGQYDNVVTEANKIVSATAPFKATTGVPLTMQAVVGNVYKTYNTTESVLSMPFTSAETPGGQNQLATYFGGLGAAEFYINPTSALYLDPLWKTTDARRVLIKAGAKMYSIKYATPSPYTDWAPVIRYPEVLLNLAEARSNLFGATDPQAIALLNAVRQRSDPTTTFTTATVPTILEERNIEFLAEGFRWNDLWRLNLDIPAKSNLVSAVPAGSAAYIWPISANEQTYNHLIGR